MDFVDLGKKVQILRKERGFSQEKLAELSDISIAYLSKIENYRAKNISLAIICRLADALSVSVSYLVADSKTEQTDMLDQEILTCLSKCSVTEKKKVLKIMNVLLEDDKIA